MYADFSFRGPLLVILALGGLARLVPRLKAWAPVPFAAFVVYVGFVYARRNNLEPFIVFLGLFGGFGYFLSSRDDVQRSLFRLVWLPSLVAGLVCAWTTFDIAYTAFLGLAPGLLAHFLILVREGETRAPAGWGAVVVRGVSAVALGGVAWFFLAWHQSEVYRDLPRAQLTVRVEQGPFRGLRTSPVKADFLRALQRDLDRLPAGGHIVFYDDFPAGFLFSDRRPATCAVWVYTNQGTRSVDYRRTYRDCVASLAASPLYAVRLKVDARDPKLAAAEPLPDDPVHAALSSCAENLLVSTQAYEMSKVSVDCLRTKVNRVTRWDGKTK